MYRMKHKELEELLQASPGVHEQGFHMTEHIIFEKKRDGTLRFCVDYCALNKITMKNHDPIPPIDDLLDSLHGALYFIKIDLCCDYHRINIKEEDIPTRAFRTWCGLYEFEASEGKLRSIVSHRDHKFSYAF